MRFKALYKNLEHKLRLAVSRAKVLARHDKLFKRLAKEERRK